MHFLSSSTFIYIVLAAAFIGCTSSEDRDSKQFQPHNAKGEYIYRKHDESFFAVAPPEKVPPKAYPWNASEASAHTKISKEFFRCKGSSLNPCHVGQQKGNEEVQRHFDCGGAEKHSLPLKDGKEFIYSILIELTNYIQEETNKKVVITCGHRCPEHNTYSDPSPSNQYSKHMIGAEVDFYVQGLEDHPEQIIALIQKFYQTNLRYKGQKDYDFKRYEKSDANVATPPWFNKEVFIKIYSKGEGRDFDNRHPYPYISIQVRHDHETNEKVIYSWDKAFRNFHRR